MEIDITGIDKVEPVKALYEGSAVRGMGIFQAKKEPLSDEEAAELAAHPHLDYVHGRVMKISVAEDSMRVDLYNRDNGRGAAERIVAELRK